MWLTNAVLVISKFFCVLGTVTVYVALNFVMTCGLGYDPNYSFLDWCGYYPQWDTGNESPTCICTSKDITIALACFLGLDVIFAAVYFCIMKIDQLLKWDPLLIHNINI